MVTIISLADAKKINPDITAEDIRAFEETIRVYSNNKFQDRDRRSEIVFIDAQTIQTGRRSNLYGFRKGDRIEVTDSEFNNGLYTIQSLTEDTLTVAEDNPFIIPPSKTPRGTITKISYPPDVIRGVKKMMEYDAAMIGTIGIKSRTVSRLSTTYQDVNAGDNAEGYPAAMLSFLQKYKRMGWE